MQRAVVQVVGIAPATPHQALVLDALHRSAKPASRHHLTLPRAVGGVPSEAGGGGDCTTLPRAVGGVPGEAGGGGDCVTLPRAVGGVPGEAGGGGSCISSAARRTARLIEA